MPLFLPVDNTDDLVGLGAPRPTRMKAYCKIIIAGVDVTEKFDPFLTEVEVDYEESSNPCAKITLDDRYGRIQMPEGTEDISITLGWQDDATGAISGAQIVFVGSVKDIESYGQKTTGRMMSIEAQGQPTLFDPKTPMSFHLGEGASPDGNSTPVTIESALQKAAQTANAQITVDPYIGAMQRNYIAANGESFQSFAARIARETGGVLNLANGVYSITRGDSFVPSITGQVIQCFAGPTGNILSWRIKPQVARPQYQTAGSMHWDPQAAKMVMSTKDFAAITDFSAPKSKYIDHAIKGSQDHVDQANGAAAVIGSREMGTGWLVIIGEPAVVQNCGANITGIREGVDGGYGVPGYTHNYRRGGGFTTRLQVNHPNQGIAIRGAQLGQ